MASSGSITNQFRTGYKLRINWSVTSQSTANNTSTMTVTAQLISDGSSYTIRAGTVSKNISITVNGTTYSGTTTATIDGGATKNLFTQSGIVVPHNSDGTKTVAISCSFGIAVTLSGTYWGTISASGSGVLNTIPRASTCSFGVFTMGSNNTITITSADTSFTHTLWWYFGSKSERIGNERRTERTITFNPNPATYGWEIPNTDTGVGAIVLITFNSAGSEIGRIQYGTTCKIPNTYKPTISSISTSVAVATINTQFGGYVKGKTGVTTTINVDSSGACGATVTSYQTTILGTTYNGQTITSANLGTVGTVKISCTIKDSRGNPHTLTKDITVLDYANPSIGSFTAVRNSTTQTTINCSYSFTIASVNSKNGKELKYRSRVAGGTWSSYTALSISGFTGSGTFNITGASAESSYEVELYLADYFSSVIKTITVSTAFVTMDFLKGGKGLAIGKVAETASLFDIAMNTKITGTVTVVGGLSATSLGATGTVSGNTLSLTANGVTTTINSQNGSYTHYVNGATSGHWFNKAVYIQGNAYAGTSYNRRLAYVDEIYPVGAIFFSTSSTNPSTYFGGTWERYAKGRVIVGLSEGDGLFGTVGGTGGGQTQELRALIGATNNDVARIGYASTGRVGGNTYGYSVAGTNVLSNVAETNINHSTLVLQTNGQNPTTVQAYITTYIWRRTA